MKENNQKRTLMRSPPHPNLLKRYTSQTNLNKKEVKTKISEEYCPKHSKKEFKKLQQPTKMKVQNEENLLPLSSQLKQSSQFSDSCSPTFQSELLRKRVSFGQDKYCYSRTNNNRRTKIEPQRRSSILKSDSRISVFLFSNERSNSIVSLKTSIEKNLGRKDKVCEKELTLAKYKKILEDLQGKKKESKQMIYKGEKYTDTLFPPVLNSIFLSKHLRQQQRKTQEIMWKRIPDVFKGKRLRLKKEVGEESSIRIKSGKYGSSYLSQALQGIKNVDDFLSWMFSETSLNVFGVYCLKIYQNNTIKYIVVDDFIPVIADSQHEWVPAFVDVETLNTYKYHSKAFQIWPFLLQKAYASYYSSYQSLKLGNVKDFIEQITGNTFVSCSLPELKNKPITNSQIVLQKLSQERYVQCLLPSILNRKIEKGELELQIMKYGPPSQIVSKILPGKEDKGEGRPNIILKHIVVKKNLGECSISIRQKDQKFYHHSLGGYQYLWVRAILLMTEYDGSYHWIDGKYSQNKSINFTLTPKEGNYYLLVMPQWKQCQKGQISVIFNTSFKECPVSDYVSINCLPYIEKQKMLEKGCGDLAQRVGQLRQLNKVTCSYNYVCKKSGLVIESVLNQRISGEIAIERQWKSTSKLLFPFNEEFKEGKKRRVEIVIPREGSYTWIFGCLGGLHRGQLETFDFK